MTSADLVGPFVRRTEYSLLLGASFAGKTSLILQLIAELQQERGGTFLGLPVPPGLRTALITSDQSAQEYKERATHVGADLHELYHWWHLSTDLTVNSRQLAADPFPLFLSHMNEVIRAQGPVDVLIVEPFPAWLNLNLNSYHQPIPALRELNRWLSVHHCGLLGTHHVDKVKRDPNLQYARPLDRVNGSTTLNAHAHAVLVLERAVEIITRNPSPTQARLTAYQRQAADQTIWLDRDPTNPSRWVPFSQQVLTASVLTVAQEGHARALLGLLAHAGAPIPFPVLKLTLGPPVGLTRDILQRLAPVLEGLDYLARTTRGWTILAKGHTFLGTSSS